RRGPGISPDFLRMGGGATHQGEGCSSLCRWSRERRAPPSAAGAGAGSFSLCRWSGDHGAGASAAGAGSLEREPPPLERGAWSGSPLPSPLLIRFPLATVLNVYFV